MNKENVINIEVVKEIKKTFKENHLIAVVTSKSYTFVEEYLEPIIDFIHFFVGNNGAILIDKIKNEVMKTQKTLNIDFINNIMRDVKLLGGIVQIITSKRIFVGSYVSSLKNQKWLTSNIKNKYIEPFKRYAEGVLRSNEVIQLTILLNPDLVNELTIFLKKFYNDGYEFTSSLPWSIDVNASGINKYEGIRAIMLLYKIKMENTFCFVDSENDLILVSNIENSYAMENSVDVIKENVKNIIGMNDDNTIALEIKKILKK